MNSGSAAKSHSKHGDRCSIGSEPHTCVQKIQGSGLTQDLELAVTTYLCSTLKADTVQNTACELCLLRKKRKILKPLENLSLAPWSVARLDLKNVERQK